MSLEEVRHAAHGVAAALLRRKVELALGRPVEPLGSTLARHPEAFEPGVAGQVLEAARSAAEKGLAPRARRLTVLASALFDQRVLSLEPGASERLSAPAAIPPPAGAHATVVEAARAVRRTTSREERRRLFHLAADGLRARRDDHHRLVEAIRRSAAEAGFAGPVDAMKALHGFEPSALCASAEAFLAATEATYQDVLAWWLRRTAELRPHPDGAMAFDVEFALGGPLAPDARPKGDIAASLLRLSRPLGLGARVRQEVASGSGVPDRPAAFVVDAPADVRVVARPAADWGDVHGHLVAAGAAFHSAGVDAARPAEDRLLGDEAVPLATGFAFGSMLFDVRWLKLTLGADGSDLVRLLRLMDLSEARREAAALLSWRERLEGVRSDAGFAAERMSLALGGTVEPGAHETDVSAAVRFRARLTGAAMATWLCERFDEDWWRNPAAGAVLRGLFAAGGFLSLDELAAVAGGMPTVDRLAGAYARAMQ
jgi:hypothetical protein